MSHLNSPNTGTVIQKGMGLPDLFYIFDVPDVKTVVTLNTRDLKKNFETCKYRYKYKKKI